MKIILEDNFPQESEEKFRNYLLWLINKFANIDFMEQHIKIIW